MIHLHCLLMSRKITQKIQPHLVVCVTRQQDEWIVSLMLPRLTFFDSMCKESLEVGFLALLTNNWESTQAKRHLCQEQRKLPTKRNLNQATIQLQLSFLIATRSVGVARSWEELQWRWKRLDTDRTTNALRWLAVFTVWRDARRLWPQSVKYCERLVKKKKIQGETRETVVAYHSISNLLQKSPFIIH